MLADSISIQIELIDNGFKYSTDGYTDDIKEWKYCYVPEGSKTVFWEKWKGIYTRVE